MKFLDFLAAKYLRDAPAAPPRPDVPGRMMKKMSRSENNANAALTLESVYRAVSIISTAVSQLTLDAWKNNKPLETVPRLLTDPSVNADLVEFLDLTATSLALHGNAYWKIYRDPKNQVSSLDVLDPNHMVVSVNKNGRIEYSYHGEELPRHRVSHLKILSVPGEVLGVGPLQAGRRLFEFALDMRSYVWRWFSNDSGGIPSGVLKSDQPLSPDQAEEAKKRWHEFVKAGDIAVLGAGLSYTPIMLKPADMLYLDAQKLTATEVARTFGVPPNAMIVGLEGNSMTYANANESNQQFMRLTLMKYLRAIEKEISKLLPHGTSARFNCDGFLRMDTKSRYEAHAIALSNGFLTINEVRKIEGLDPLTETTQIKEEAGEQTGEETEQ